MKTGCWLPRVGRQAGNISCCKRNPHALRARFRVIVALSHSSDTRCVVYVFILRIYVRISIPEAAKVCLRKLQAVLVQLAWRTRMYLYGGAG